MIEGEEVLFRPVMRGMYRAESLLDGTIDLDFVMLCNEAIDVESENENRAHEYEQRKRRKP